jgi:hypothetical protein
VKAGPRSQTRTDYFGSPRLETYEAPTLGLEQEFANPPNGRGESARGGSMLNLNRRSSR